MLERRMMAMVNDSTGQDMSSFNKYVVEVNPKHQIIVDLNALREVNAPLAEKVARQVRIAVVGRCRHSHDQVRV